MRLTIGGIFMVANNFMQKNKFSIVLIGNIIFAILMIIATVVFLAIDITPYITKTIASALFVLCGVFNLALVFYKWGIKKCWQAWIMLLGLIFAFVGDVVLISNFVLGAVFFALGHIFFLIYFCLYQKIKWQDIVIALVIFVLSLLLILLFPQFDFNGMQVVAIIYALVISMMLGKAVGNYVVNRSVVNLIIMLGAILFFFSDAMLLFNVFTDISPLFDYFCISTYYPAEYLLALSIYIRYAYLPSTQSEQTGASDKSNTTPAINDGASQS